MKLHEIVQSLDEPKTVFDKSLIWLLLALTYLTVLSLIAEEVAPEYFAEYIRYFEVVEYFSLLFFSLEYLVRIVTADRKFKYIFSFYGIVDALSVLPSLLGILIGGNISSLWVRVFKVLRLVRLLKLIKLGDAVGGIVGQLIPFFAAVIAFKGIVVVLEHQSWWVDFNNLNIVIGVVGFALAILLGTKLRDVHSRLFAIEDTVCRIVGALRDMQNQKEIRYKLLAWSTQLEQALKSPRESKKGMAMLMREKTDALEEQLEIASIGGPTTAGFHRDVAYLLHQMTRKTPEAYDKFLKYVVISYSFVVILAVPGLIGFISSLLIVYILGGMYMLIDDMDEPLGYSDDSYIDVRLDALEYYNSYKTDLKKQELNEDSKGEYNLYERKSALNELRAGI